MVIKHVLIELGTLKLINYLHVHVHDIIRKERKKERKTPEAMEK